MQLKNFQHLRKDRAFAGSQNWFPFISYLTPYSNLFALSMLYHYITTHNVAHLVV